MIDTILEGKMGPMGNNGIFSDESPPGNNLGNNIVQFCEDTKFIIKFRNGLNSLQINLKLLINYVRNKGKLKVQLVIEESWFIFQLRIKIRITKNI
jgi:hypothetical protein